MPRNVKESDDEVETKGGRRTRAALNPSVMDSPLRRSTRIKQPTSQDVSSPESVSDVSSIGGTKNTRRRTTTNDTGIRVRRNSVASDISELTETESLPDGPSRRITRRSLAAVSSADTPTKLNGRTRRATRAGSETKSTPPVVRATRRTRASSMEPEISEEPNLHDVGTPVKSRKRASAMPSEPAVAEESDEGRSANVVKTAEKTVYELDEDESGVSTQSMSTSLRQKTKSDTNESDEKMEVDGSPVKGTEADAIEQKVQEATEASRKLDDSVKIADSPDGNAADNKATEDQKLSSPSKGSPYTIENILNNSSEKQSPGNKENEVLNSSVQLIEKNNKLADNDVRLLTRKSFNSAFTKFVARRRSISSDDASLFDSREPKTTAQTEGIAFTETSTRPSETVVRKEYMAANCVVVIEPMDINQVDKGQPNITTEPLKTNEVAVFEADGNASVPNHEEQIEKSEKIIQKNNEDASNNKDIVDNDSNLKMSNVVSMVITEEKYTKEDKAIDDAHSKKVERMESTETIELESDVTNEGEISLINISEDDEDQCTEKSNIPEETNARSSITNEKPQEIEENSLSEIVKGKSSIVTESPVTGTDVEETLGLNEERNDKSASNGASPKKLIQEVEAESAQKTKETPAKVLESDDESDYNGFPAFQDIPADEWTGPEKRNEDETNSVHSASTERNESEYEIQLLDKEPSVDNRVEKSDYDTDDTLIVPVNKTTAVKETKEKKNMELIDEEIPMDLSSDPDEDEGGVSKSPKKRASLATPRKSIGSNKTPTNKNESVIANTSVKESTTPLNVSRRKSSNIMEAETTNSENPVDDDANVSIKSTRSSSKSPKKRTSSSTRLRIDSSSDSEAETENDASKTPKTVQNANRKSLEASAKKLDSSRMNVSAKNTPTKIENGTPAKRRSSNKFASDVNGDGSNDSYNSENQNNSQSNFESGLTQSELDEAEACEKVVLEGASKQQEKRRSSVSKLSEESELSRGSPLNSKERNTSIKVGSAKKSLSNRNSQSKIAEADSESDDEDSTTKHNSSKSNDAKASKNNSFAAQENSDSEIHETDSKQVSANRKSDAGKLDKSVTFGSAKKSKANKNSSKIDLENSDSEADEEDQQEIPEPDVQNKFNKSGKLGSMKKSKVNKNNSKLAPENSDSDGDDEDSQETRSSPEFEAQEKLNKSAKSGNIKKSKNNKNDSKISPEFSDSEMEVDVSNKVSASSIIDLREKLNKSAKSRGRKSSLSKDSLKLLPLNSESDTEEDAKSKNTAIKSRRESAKILLLETDKNYSTIAQVNSDSESMVSSSSDEEINATNLIPQFFFDQDTTSSSNSDLEDEESSDTIDSDVARDLNLHGKSKIDYSDDDVPADDCMATESESFDSDDDGADLMDFVVEDDEDDSFEDVAMELGANDDESNDSYSRKTKKLRKRIIPRPGGESDSDESEENDVHTTNESTDVDKSPTAKTPKEDEKLNKTPKIIEPETPAANLNVSLKAANKKNKNLLLQSSTPKGVVRERLSLEKANNTPKAATPLSKSLKQADSSLKKEAVQTSSTKKLSKSVCETVDTPIKLGSSFKVKTPKSAVTTPKQLQTSLPTDLSDSASKLNLSKTKSIKVSTLHQTMLTPNTESPEKRFLMKEKLNDSCPALKLQQKAKASRRSTLDNLREEVALIDENLEVSEEQAENEIAQNASLRATIAAIDEEVENVEKKKKKKKKKLAKNVNTSTDLNEETLAMSKDTEKTLTTDDNSKSLETDASQKISKKKNKKKKKITETETEEPIESKSSEKPKKDKKRKSKENLEEVQIKDTDKKDKKDKKKNKRAEIVDEIEASIGKNEKKKKKHGEIAEEVDINETSKDKKKKKNRDAAIDESEAIEVSKKDKKGKHEKTAESVEPSISKKHSRRVEKNVASDSDDEPEAINFTEARAAALIDRKKLTESIKAGREAKKNKHQPLQVTNTKEQRKIKTQAETGNVVGTSKTNLKRLPDELLDSLSSTVERPKKRRKIAKAEKILPSRTMLGSRHQLPSSPITNDGYIPLSGSGGTTQFEVAIMSKAKKAKKAVAAASFRERMLARNTRQPISAYLMYQQKQKASGKDRPY